LRHLTFDFLHLGQGHIEICYIHKIIHLTEFSQEIRINWMNLFIQQRPYRPDSPYLPMKKRAENKKGALEKGAFCS